MIFKQNECLDTNNLITQLISQTNFKDSNKVSLSNFLAMIKLLKLIIIKFNLKVKLKIKFWSIINYLI